MRFNRNRTGLPSDRGITNENGVVALRVAQRRKATIAKPMPSIWAVGIAETAARWRVRWRSRFGCPFQRCQNVGVPKPWEVLATMPHLPIDCEASGCLRRAATIQVLTPTTNPTTKIIGVRPQSCAQIDSLHVTSLFLQTSL
jgi:hypothetical protein